MKKKTSNTRDQYTITGDKIVSKVKELIKEGNARRIIIKNEKGITLLEMPLTVGVIGTILVPPLAALGALGALVAKCTIVVVKK